MTNEPNETAQHAGAPEQAAQAAAGQPAQDAAPTAPTDAQPTATQPGGPRRAKDASDQPVADQDDDATRVAELEALVAERTADLQRLQAEYVNYKRRVDRDRELARQAGVEKVVVDLLPVLDSIDMARGHDELNGGFKLVADELEKVAAKYGLEGYGAVGDAFDPVLHEALMQMPMDDIEVTTCSQVMQRGYQLHGKVLRPARVAVAEPQ